MLLKSIAYGISNMKSESKTITGGTIMDLRKILSAVTLAKLRLSSHPEASRQSLMKLSRHDCPSVVARVAENSNTPIEVLGA